MADTASTVGVARGVNGKPLGGRVDAVPSRALLAELVERGWTKAELARRLGITRERVTTIIGGGAPMITAGTERLVAQLHADLDGVAPPKRRVGRRCGTHSAYVGGCHCDRCTAAATRAAKRRELHGTDLVDAAPVRAHLAQLRAAGMGKRRISKLSGVSHTVICRLLGIDRSKPANRVRPSTAAKLLALQPEPAVVDATGARRRLQALVAVGYPGDRLVAASSMSRPTYDGLVSGRAAQVFASTAAAVAALYDDLSMTPGPSTRARTFAARKGWVPPLAWDDDAIDDPAATPDLGDGRGRSADAMLASILELIAWGDRDAAVIGARLGCTAGYVAELLTPFVATTRQTVPASTLREYAAGLGLDAVTAGGVPNVVLAHYALAHRDQEAA